MKYHLCPLKLGYITKSRIWGGNKLRDLGFSSEEDNIAEAWVMTSRENEDSVLLGNRFKTDDGEELTLGGYIERYGKDTVKDGFSGDFPLLVKLIDAKDDLSVQLHPDDAYARAVEGEYGKTEMWYILDAEPGAEIVYGLAKNATVSDFCEALDSGDGDAIMSTLGRVGVKKGDCFFVPPGTVHAIGGGILLAEIQQNSDITYRVYDFDRVGKDGSPRELHTAKAMQTVRKYGDAEINELRYENITGTPDENLLADNKYFRTELIDADAGEVSVNVTKESFGCLLCISEERVRGRVSGSMDDTETKFGDCLFIPAGSGEIKINGGKYLYTTI